MGRHNGSIPDTGLEETDAGRRAILCASPLLMALPQLLMAGTSARAAPDPTKTIVQLSKDLVFKQRPGDPPNSVETAALFSDANSPGIYYNLTRWYPGYMSGPHLYDTDRLCVVVSGTWWVNSGDTFDPDGTVPVGPGSFVRRVAHTSHYDGVKADGTEPALIAICGIGPVNYHKVDPTKPLVRKV